jgi:hypothetical protein
MKLSDRQYQVFLSYAHSNRKFVDKVYNFLIDSGIQVWYDGVDLPTNENITSYLPTAIQNCKAIIIFISKKSIESNWVQDEYSFAKEEQSKFKNFKIITICIEDKCENLNLGFLKNTRWINMSNCELNIQNANDLLLSIYYDDIMLKTQTNKDVYVSLGWHDNEYEINKKICSVIGRRFRLIGDSKDRLGFKDNRIKEIISSCGALIAIVPNRGNGKTSKYILQEINYAKEMKIPYLIFTDKDVYEVNFKDEKNVIIIDAIDNMEDIILYLEEEWLSPKNEHYVFYGTSFKKANTETSKIVKNLLEQVTAMPCIMGKDIVEKDIQTYIAKKISKAFLVLTDISETNSNTLVETGIAIGANINLYLLAQGNPEKLFMFRNRQYWIYEDEVELLAQVHKIAYLYRRRVLNYDFN